MDDISLFAAMNITTFFLLYPGLLIGIFTKFSNLPLAEL